MSNPNKNAKNQRTPESELAIRKAQLEAQIAVSSRESFEPMVKKKLQEPFESDHIVSESITNKLDGDDIKNLVVEFIEVHGDDINQWIDVELESKLKKGEISHDYKKEEFKGIKEKEIQKIKKEMIKIYTAKSIVACVVDDTTESAHRNTLFDYLKQEFTVMSDLDIGVGLFQKLITSNKLNYKQICSLMGGNFGAIISMINKNKFTDQRYIDLFIENFMTLHNNDQKSKDHFNGLVNQYTVELIGLIKMGKITNPKYVSVFISYFIKEDDEAAIQELLDSHSVAGKDLQKLVNYRLKNNPNYTDYDGHVYVPED